MEANLAALRSGQLYTNQDRYQRAVADVNRMLELAGLKKNITLSLANYQDAAVSPLKSGDLIVITSYSIHYTKLYDQRQPAGSNRRAAG